MKLIIGLFFLVLCASATTATDSIDDDALRADFFKLYKELATGYKELTNSTVTRDQVTFPMYRNNPSPKEAILNSSNLDLLKQSTGKIVFAIHGWTHKPTIWATDFKDAYLAAYPDSVVITVDWAEPASQFYTISSINTYDVGNFVGDMIIDLVNDEGVDISRFLLIGHSLGAQVTGFAAKRVKKVGKLLPRIVGLDPASPLFSIRPEDKRLNPSDAEVVEVLHSNGGTFGVSEVTGTIDFFANGGSAQPGCSEINILEENAIANILWCNHQRAYLYFIEAIQNPNMYSAKKCTLWSVVLPNCDENDTVILGDLTTSKTGKYYFETNKQKPFYKEVAKSQGIFDDIVKN